MNISVSTKTSADRQKQFYYLEWGKRSGERRATGIYAFANPTDKAQKRHNDQARLQVDRARAALVMEMGATGGIKKRVARNVNFYEFYEQYIIDNPSENNRHLSNSLRTLRIFHGSPMLYVEQVTEDYCTRFRDWLLKNFRGETPANYFARFKRVIAAATKAGFFPIDPSKDVKSRANKSEPKDILSEDEYTKLLATPCLNHEVKRAFLFSMYTGMAFADVKQVTYKNIDVDVVRYSRKKTEEGAPVPLHPIAMQVIGKGEPRQKLFKLPTADGCNKILGEWMKLAGITKHITWHSARHSISVILQSRGVDVSTVAGLLGQASSEYVLKTYRRYVVKNGIDAINRLPGSIRLPESSRPPEADG